MMANHFKISAHTGAQGQRQRIRGKPLSTPGFRKIDLAHCAPQRLMFFLMMRHQQHLSYEFCIFDSDADLQVLLVKDGVTGSQFDPLFLGQSVRCFPLEASEAVTIRADSIQGSIGFGKFAGKLVTRVSNPLEFIA